MTTETDADGKPVTRLYLTPEQIALLFDDGQTEADIAVEGLGPVVKVSMPAEPLLSELRDHSDARLRVVVNGNGLLVPLSAVGKLHVEATLTATIVQ
ncbi:hypothetical protein K0U00_51215, partial [Paenibacillus sepulcri]|nr:hypothetical protein [Paenibacillus sepulcri]